MATLPNNSAQNLKAVLDEHQPWHGHGSASSLSSAGPAKPAVMMTTLLACEQQPPAGQPALVWRLLTNRPTEILEDADQLINWYRKRWMIEVFPRIWKAGCWVEALQLGTLERLVFSKMDFLSRNVPSFSYRNSQLFDIIDAHTR